jgi:hypothetical protein
MHRDHDLTFAPLFMLLSVKATAALAQPFPECGAFHCVAPMYLQVALLAQIVRTSALYVTGLFAYPKFSDAFIDLRQAPK